MLDFGEDRIVGYGGCRFMFEWPRGVYHNPDHKLVPGTKVHQFVKWCEGNLIGKYFPAMDGIYIQEEEDAMAMKLRWE